MTSTRAPGRRDPRLARRHRHPQAARDYLTSTFEKENAGSKLVIEEQQWTGLVDKLTTSLSSNGNPDIVEMGNTQAPAFTSAPARSPTSAASRPTSAATTCSRLRRGRKLGRQALRRPYYSGRLAFYNTKQYKEAGVEVPPRARAVRQQHLVTLTEKLDGVSGVWFPGKDWYNALPFIWENGGEIAVAGADGTWDAQFSSAESRAGLKQVQEVMTKGSLAPQDGDETESWVPFRTEKAATLSAPS